MLQRVLKLFQPKMGPVELVLPDIHYRKSFVKAWKRGEQLGQDGFIADMHRSYQRHFIENFQNKMKLGWYHPWFLVSGDTFLGLIELKEADVAHVEYQVNPYYQGKGYGTEMLGLALPRFKERGHSRVLLRVNRTNPSCDASRRVIEKNGGQLEKLDGDLYYYWIDLTSH